MPAFTKVSHISFSARDASKSARWWQDVFGFEPLATVTEDTWRGELLIHPSSRTIIEFQQHDANAGEPFDPTRTGFDHMGLLVESRAELDEWQRHFERRGVEHTPVVEADYDDVHASVLTFKDPDRIQFEMFYIPDHP